MTKVILSDVQNLNDQPSTQAVINNNSATLEAAFENTLSRDGSSPNTMQSTLDMNSFQIINLPAPTEADAPLRLQDLSSFVGGGTVTNIPAGGATGQVLGKTGSADYQVGWENSVTSVGLALPADLTVTNSPITTTGTLTGAWATTPTGTGAMVRATSPTLVTPALGTPASGVATNLTGTAAGLTAGNVTTNANLTGVITSVGNATSIASQTGTGTKFVVDTSPTLVTPALGTPSSGVATNLTGTAAGLTAGNVTTNANLTGVITSSGNTTSIASQTGTGTKFVVDTSPTLVTPALGTPSSGVATNLTGTASGLTAGHVTTNANLTGPITSTGNATTVASQTGTGSNFVMDTSPTLVTPTIGAATATSINKMAITAPATSSTLAVANGKTLTASNTLTLAGTDATTITFQGSDTYVGRATTDTLTNKSIVATQLTGTLAAGQFPALTGDVTTVAGAVASTIGTNIVTNAKAAQMAAKTVKLNATNALANATDTAISALTDISTPSATLDWIMIEDHTAGTIKKTNASELLSAVGSGVTSFNSRTGAVIPAAADYTLNQVTASATNDSATAGYIGEYVVSTIAVGSAVSLTSGTTTNITSISLTAGDWDVWLDARLTGGASTTITVGLASISTTSATYDLVLPGRVSSVVYSPGAAVFSSSDLRFTTGPARISLSGTTTVYFVILPVFAVSTLSGYGSIMARRRR